MSTNPRIVAGTFSRPFVATGARQLTLVPKQPTPQPGVPPATEAAETSAPAASAGAERREAIPAPRTLWR
jgi:hypothetical protein